MNGSFLRFYVHEGQRHHFPARFGVINPDSADPPSVASGE